MTGRFPFPIPRGWFFVAYSDELAVGEVRTLHYFERELVLFRGADKVAHVVDAFCPHLGAHLGHGGTVIGSTLRCPFHGWRYDGDGTCVEVPYATKIPSTARLETWPTIERNGFVLVWYDPDGVEPGFEIPIEDAFAHPDWTPYDRYFWNIASCCQEIFENSTDQAHFRFVHGTEGPKTRFETDGCAIRTHSRMRMDTPRGPVDGGIDGAVFGLGYGVFKFSGIIDTLLFNLITPIDRENVEFRFAISIHARGNEKAAGGVGRALMADLIKQTNEDVPIWEAKRHIATPLLCDGDVPIAAFRRHVQQFYP